MPDRRIGPYRRNWLRFTGVDGRETRMMIRLVLSLALLAAGCAAVGAGADASAFDYAPRRMADGKLWTTRNLAVVTSGSYCYGGAQANCRRYGRLYSWQAAQ